MFATRYARYLTKYPIATKCITSGILAGLGDGLCQLKFEKHPFDVRRWIMFTSLGGLYIGPTLHVWYRFINAKYYGASGKMVLKRLFMDQFVFAPICTPVFMGLIVYLEKKDTSQVKLQIQNCWWNTMKSNWMVWIPAQFLNFKVVPVHYQVLFSNMVGMFWNSYMSYISHRKQSKGLKQD